MTTNLFQYRVKELAEKKGLDKSKLSRKANISLPTVRRYWNNEVERPSSEVLSKIAEALETTVDELMLIQSEAPQSESQTGETAA